MLPRTSRGLQLQRRSRSPELDDRTRLASDCKMSSCICVLVSMMQAIDLEKMSTVKGWESDTNVDLVHVVLYDLAGSRQRGVKAVTFQDGGATPGTARPRKAEPYFQF